MNAPEEESSSGNYEYQPLIEFISSGVSVRREKRREIDIYLSLSVLVVLFIFNYNYSPAPIPSAAVIPVGAISL
jgi:hypothetical protein